MYRELGQKQDISSALNGLGDVARLQGDYARAAVLYRESLALRRELADKRGSAIGLVNLGTTALAQEDTEQAARLYRESLELNWRIQYMPGIAYCLFGFAGISALQRLPERAARLAGAAAALYDAIGLSLPEDEHDLRGDRIEANVRDQLDETTFAAAWAAGHAMPLEQAIAEALEPLPEVTPPTAPPVRPQPTTPTGAYPAGLTAREVEVLRLIAQGLTDAQVAERLIVSAHTVHAHLRAIYGKLEVTSRAAATRFAVEHHLM